ncbi:seipin-1 [Syzygium oleosum]|uniref:seipin-1 n=1 Tax=Syzygium oleosum TaxID=219896 RepID=UPI0024BB5F7E|nr:seipin-1 [Syzygium oleosum]
MGKMHWPVLECGGSKRVIVLVWLSIFCYLSIDEVDEYACDMHGKGEKFILPKYEVLICEMFSDVETVVDLETNTELICETPPPPPPPESSSSHWFTRLLFLQAELIYKCIVSLLSPILSLLSLASDSYHRAEEAKDSVESAVHRVPSDLCLLLKRLGLGFIASTYVCMVLSLLMALSVMVGGGLVRMWVEEPVFVTQRLYLDYTRLHPQAIFSFCGGVDGGVGLCEGFHQKKHAGIPVGHTFSVSLLLLMPESDYNCHIGVFQVTAELLSVNGEVIARSSQPCMLRFRSLPVRLMRTLVLGIPLLLGVSAETQKIKVEALKHKEPRHPRTAAIRITLIPRARTSSPPQVYEAQITMHSQLPWAKEVVRNWRWSFCVWASLCTYIALLLALLCCSKTLVLPSGSATGVSPTEHDGESEMDAKKSNHGARKEEARVGDDGEVAELLRKWQQSRGKRKARFASEFRGGEGEEGSSAASSRNVTREDTSASIEEDEVGDSESVCLS